MWTKVAPLVALFYLFVAGSALADVIPSLFKIRAAGCTNGAEDRRLTGFVLSGVEGIITALHGVLGCRIVTAQQAEPGSLVVQQLAISAADVERDIAVLSGVGVDATKDLRLPLAKESDPPTNLKVWGFPMNVLKPFDANVTIRSIQFTTWNDLTPEARKAMQARRSPSPTARMLNIQGPITLGHSGAPIVNGEGQVVGVANGGLAGGTLDIALAAPIWDFSPKSRDQVASELERLAVLNASELFSDVQQTDAASSFAKEGIEFSEAELLRRVKNNDSVVARRLIEAGISPNATDAAGHSAVVTAAESFDPEIVQLLIEKGADLRARHGADQDVDGWRAFNAPLTLLAQFSKNPDISALERFIAKAPRFPELPRLSRSAQIIRLLIRELNDRRIESASGMSAAKLAVLINDNASLEYVLTTMKTRPEAPTELASWMFAAVLSEAGRREDLQSSTDDLSSIELLARAGADINAHLDDAMLSRVKDVEPQWSSSPFERLSVGQTPLVLAAAHSQRSMRPLRKLVALKPDLDNRGPGGATALMAAGNDEAALLLLRAGASTTVTDDEGWTPLMYALNKGSFQGYGNRLTVLDAMISNGADVNARDGKGSPAFMQASHPDPELISYFVAHKFDLTARGPHGETALMAMATRYPQSVPQLIVALLNAGIDSSARDSNGNTALIWFAAGGFFSHPLPGEVEKLVEAFKAHGADLNAVNNQGRTALIASIMAPFNVPLAEGLIRAGANVNLRDKSGKTALSYARSKVGLNDWEVKALIEHLIAAKAVE